MTSFGITQKQFPEVYRIVNEISSDMDIDSPTVYVYEDYYYGAESYGISHYWIELSAKTKQDFTEAELRFLVAREIYKMGKIDIKVSILRDIAKVLNTTAGYLMDGDEMGFDADVMQLAMMLQEMKNEDVRKVAIEQVKVLARLNKEA